MTNTSASGLFPAAVERGVDRDSHLPLYLQIKREMLRRIAAWSSDTQKFYSDDELCVEFEVSRMTVRQAIKELVDEGYLTRARGLGTFLTAKKVHERPLHSAQDRLSFGGDPFELLIRKFVEVKCPPAIATSLGVEPQSKVLYIDRVRSARGVPVSLDERWLPLPIARGLKKEALQTQSLVSFLGGRHAVASAQMQFEGGLAQRDAAAALRIAPGDAVLIRHMVYLDGDGLALMSGRSIHRSDIARYAVRVPLQGE